MWWFRIADRLGHPVAYVKKWTSSADFVKWIWYIKDDYKRPSRTHRYLARIAALIKAYTQRCAVSENEMVIDFEYRKPRKLSPEEQTMIARAGLGLGYAIPEED